MNQQQINCRHYGSMRGCKYGNNCRYDHSNPNSVELCSHYKNSCEFGNNCKFRHINFYPQRETNPHQSNPNAQHLLKHKQFQYFRETGEWTYYAYMQLKNINNQLPQFYQSVTFNAEQIDKLPPTIDKHVIMSDCITVKHPESSETYFANMKITETSWTIAPDWIAVKDHAFGETYFVNIKTRETSWTMPTVKDDASTGTKRSGQVKRLSNHRLVVHGYIRLIIQPLLSKNNFKSIIPIELFQIIHWFYKSFQLNSVDFILMQNKPQKPQDHYWSHLDKNKNRIYVFGSVGSNSVSNKCIDLGSFMNNGSNNSAYVTGKNIHLKYPFKSIWPHFTVNYLVIDHDQLSKQGYHGIFKGGGKYCDFDGRRGHCWYDNSLSVTIFKENIFDDDYFDNESLDSLDIELPSLPKRATYQMVYNNFIGLFVASGNE
eukprot:232597_1